MRFQVGICPEEFQLDQTKNGQLPATINFIMPDIWQTMSDYWTIILKQNMRFQGGICPEKPQLDQIQNGRLEDNIGITVQPATNGHP